MTVEGETFRAARALPRARDRQPDRVRRHLPAAGGAARPVPAAGELRLPRRRRGVRRAAAPARPPPGGGRRWTQVTDAAGLPALQAAVEPVAVDESVGRYCVDLAAATREHADVLTGCLARAARSGWCSPRAPSRSLRGRDYVVPEDVKAVARAVLAHRITVKPELWMTQASGRRVVDDGARRGADTRARWRARPADDSAGAPPLAGGRALRRSAVLGPAASGGRRAARRAG